MTENKREGVEQISSLFGFLLYTVRPLSAYFLNSELFVGWVLRMRDRAPPRWRSGLVLQTETLQFISGKCTT